MIEQIRKTTGHWAVALGIILSGLLTGCQTGPKYSDVSQEQPVGTRFHLADQVTVKFVSSGGEESASLPDFSGRIQDDGTITLPLIGSVAAVGKTEGELQKSIHELYVPRYFKELNVTVKGEAALFFVLGDVNAPGQKDYPGEMTIVKAISVSGGFTDFAKRTKVRLTRGNRTQIINVQKAISDPRYDVAVYPGDKIWVPRRILW